VVWKSSGDYIGTALF